MHTGQVVEVNGDIALESAQVIPGPMGFGGAGHMPGQMSFNMFPQMGFPGGINMNFSGPQVSGFAPPPPAMGGAVPSIQSCHIHTGSRIFVRGQIHPNAKRFELNFLQGHSDSSDIVKNHRAHGHWGSEENQPFPNYMPLMPGAMIDLQVVCDPMKYLVS